MQGTLKRLVGRLPGPTAEARAKNQAQLWGEVTDAEGRTAKGRITTLDPYDLTADAVVRIAQRLAAGKVAPGAYTPSKALGADFVASSTGRRSSTRTDALRRSGAQAGSEARISPRRSRLVVAPPKVRARCLTSR